MQAIELSKQLFHGTEVRIFGTSDNPLFIAKEIGDILSIKNVRQVVNKFDADEIKGVCNVYTLGGNQQATLITEVGLYRLILKSKIPAAKDFRKWLLSEVIPTIRKTGKFDLAENIEKQQLDQAQIEKQRADKLERELEESKAENEVLKLDYKPNVVYQDIDVNELADDSCIYLIHITEDFFKFGVTNGVDNRAYDHFTYFKKKGYDPKIVNVWKCVKAKAMSIIELKIKRYAKQHAIRANLAGKTEIIKTDDIQHIVDKIDRYVEKSNTMDTGFIKIKELELTIELTKQENEGKRCEIELKKLDIDMFKLKQATPVSIQILPQIVHIEDRPDNLADVSSETESAALNPTIQHVEAKPELIDVTPITPTEKWIQNNLPTHKEVTTAYYARYTQAIKHPWPLNKFSKYIRTQGYSVIKGTKDRHWVKKH
jgi:prophage antirepressor-like protein